MKFLCLEQIIRQQLRLEKRLSYWIAGRTKGRSLKSAFIMPHRRWTIREIELGDLFWALKSLCLVLLRPKWVDIVSLAQRIPSLPLLKTLHSTQFSRRGTDLLSEKQKQNNLRLKTFPPKPSLPLHPGCIWAGGPPQHLASHRGDGKWDEIEKLSVLWMHSKRWLSISIF